MTTIHILAQDKKIQQSRHIKDLGMIMDEIENVELKIETGLIQLQQYINYYTIHF